MTTTQQLEERIAALGPWYHNIEIAPGVWTNPPIGDYPERRWRSIEPWVPDDLSGKSVLDIGCNAGFFSMQMARRGASPIVGIDIMPHVLAQARFTSERFGYAIELHEMSVYDIAQLGSFDIVMCLGVLYHLKHPLYALERVAEACRGTAYIQSVVRGCTEDFTPAPDYPDTEVQVFNEPAFPRMYFIEHAYNNDVSNWWFATHSCLKAMLRVSGFSAIQTTIDPEIFVCRR
jgi:tRNA (mo5U34)-methyltransferase